MKKLFLTIIVFLLLLAAYLILWPVPIQPIIWNAPMPPGYTGPHAVNTKLANLKMISLGKEEGPEQIVIGKDGKLYTTVTSGNILRMNPDGSEQEVFANTGGRVLGFDFDTSGNLIAADVDKGLLDIGRCNEGELVVIVAGSPPGIPGSTNALRVHRMGDAIHGVVPAYRIAQG